MNTHADAFRWDSFFFNGALLIKSDNNHSKSFFPRVFSFVNISRTETKGDGVFLSVCMGACVCMHFLYLGRCFSFVFCIRHRSYIIEYIKQCLTNVVFENN